MLVEIPDSWNKQRAGAAAGHEGLAVYYRIGRAMAVDGGHYKAVNENHEEKRHVKAEFMIDIDTEKRRHNSRRSWQGYGGIQVT